MGTQVTPGRKFDCGFVSPRLGRANGTARPLDISAADDGDARAKRQRLTDRPGLDPDSPAARNMRAAGFTDNEVAVLLTLENSVGLAIPDWPQRARGYHGRHGRPLPAPQPHGLRIRERREPARPEAVVRSSRDVNGPL